MIKLIKSTFYNEKETKERLCEFILNSESLSMGEKCKEFEEKFSSYQGRTYSVLFNSGSSANLALIQALLNLGRLKKEDSIGFSALTWSTNVAPLLQLGLNPVPIDVSTSNLNVSSENLIEVLKKNGIKALFLTNLLGFCGDIDKIKEICDEKGILLLEDTCESLGSEYQGRKLGNFGFASTFSCFVGHHMSTIEGGLVSTDNEALFEMLLMVRAHGWSRDLPEDKKSQLRQTNDVGEFFDKFTFYVPGYNLRPTEITGFLGVEQLKYLDQMIRTRKDNFERFNQVSSQDPEILELNLAHMDLVSNFGYPLVFKNEESFEKYRSLFEGKVEIRPIMSGSIVEQPFFKKYAAEKNLSYECPNAKKIHEKGFYFPNNPELSEEELSLIIGLLNKE